MDVTSGTVLARAVFPNPGNLLRPGQYAKVRAVVEGREFVVQPVYDAQVEEYLRPLFQQLYTMSFDNYPVEAERVHGMQLADCRTRA